MQKKSPKAVLLELLSKKYSSANPSALNDLATAKILLMDTGYGDHVMDLLQKSLDASKDPLDLFLLQEEEKRGFTLRKEVDSILDRDAFLDLLREGRHILDLGAGPNHGPFSHRLQWFILYHAFDEQRLTMSPLVLFKMLGEAPFKDPGSATRSMWDEIFDFDNETPRFDAARQEAESQAGYSSAEMLLLRLRGKAIPPGPLVHELRLSQLRYQTFGGGGVTDPEQALRNAISVKYALRLGLSTPNLQTQIDEYLKQFADAPIEKLEEVYCSFDPGYAKLLQAALS